MLGCSTEETSTLKLDSKKLKTTIITPHMKQEIKEGENIIFCSTFQLAWNEMKDSIIKADIKLQDEPPVVGYLNNGLSTKSDISDEDYVAIGGFAKDNIIEKINSTLAIKFNNEAPLVSETFNNPDDIFIYSFLYKNLKFGKEFESLKTPLAFNSQGNLSNVKAFGINEYSKKKHIEMGQQVEVLYYERRGYDSINLIIKLKPESLKDEIILAKIQPENTLLETIEKTTKMISSSIINKNSLQDEDELKIPKLNFDITHSYIQLLHKLFLNKGFELHNIKNAQQDIYFKLDEKGAILKSASILSGFFNKLSNGRSLVFNEPFLIYLKEQGANYPYFAIWVDNPELMIADKKR